MKAPCHAGEVQSALPVICLTGTEVKSIAIYAESDTKVIPESCKRLESEYGEQ